jgi:hypothetical protein
LRSGIDAARIVRAGANCPGHLAEFDRAVGSLHRFFGMLARVDRV